MPGSVAHMLIFEDALSRLEKELECGDLVSMLRENIMTGS